MNFLRKNIKPTHLAGLFALVTAAIAIRLALTATSFILLPATSDEAAAMLQAMKIREGATPLLFLAQPYQFPIEAYIQSLFIDWMPRNVIGARYLAMVLGWLTTAIWIVLAFYLFPAKKRWPALLLILFPSAYWLLHQAAYTPPQYAATAFLTLLLFFFGVAALRQKKSLIFLFLAGLAGGLAVSNHLVALAPLAGTALPLLLHRFHKPRLQCITTFSLGVLLGLIPYILARLTVPGAYEAVDGAVSLDAALARLLDFAAVETLPGVMGIKPTLFPDVAVNTGWGSDLRPVFFLFYLAVVCGSIYFRLRLILKDFATGQGLRAAPVDIFILSSFTVFGLFILSDKAGPDLYRFMITLIWCFPFILAFLFSAISWAPLRRLVAGFAIVYAAVNLITAIHMTTLLTKDETRIDVLGRTHDIDPVLDYLRENNHHYCYASYWVAYRITMLSDRKIICSQPYNERFPGWGNVPYKELVDAQEATPYILKMTSRPVLQAYRFMIHLDRAGITSGYQKLGVDFHIFDDFKDMRFAGYSRNELAGSSYQVFQDQDPSPVSALNDRDWKTGWQSEKRQTAGMGFTLKLENPQQIRQIKLVYPDRTADAPKAIEVHGTTLAGERLHLASSAHGFEDIIFINQKPVYDQNHHTIWIDEPASLVMLEIRIAEANKDRDWQLLDILLAEDGQPVKSQ